jgi:CheY-like chemotaxis protein
MSRPQQNSAPISLLCVDDDRGFRDVLTSFFSHEPDIILQTCSSARDALDLLNKQHFDVIMSDYLMPEMDGIELLRKIRSRGDNAFFIICTGRHLTKVAIETLNSGGNYYLQKGSSFTNDLPKALELIRHHHKNQQATTLPSPADNPYQSLIENQFVPVCGFDKNGRFRFTNRSYNQEIGKKEAEAAGFFSVIPDEERDEFLSHLTSLTLLNPAIHILQHIRSIDGSLKVFLGNYRVITDDTGKITGYTALLTNLSGIVSLSSLELYSMEEPKIKPEPVIQTISLPEPESPAPQKKKKTIKDYFAELAESVENVQYPVFAVDRAGKVIAWNHAIVELTGVKAAEMIGKDDYAHAVVLCGEKRPMLIDYIISSPHNLKLKKDLGITHDGDVYNSDPEAVTIREKPVQLWSKGASIYDAEGTMIAAVQSILVSTEQPHKKGKGLPDEEIYIGGVSSIILKVTDSGMGGAIAGAIGSAVGGYGVYVTNQRLFVIYNPSLDARRNDSITFGTFILGELFGTNVDTRSRTIDELERHKVFEVWRKDITRIELKKPKLLAGSMIITTSAGGKFRVYIDHTKAFTHLDQVLRLSYPEILWVE